MNQEDVKAEVKILLEDTLSQITDARLTQAIEKAWKDGWVCNPVWDNSSLAFDMSVYQYTIPSTMTTIDAIYLKRADTSFPEEIDGSLWEVIGNQIIFQKKAMYKVPTGYPLQLRGRYKLSATDSITNETMQNYVIALSAYNVVKALGYSRVLSFLKNDTSLAELLRFKDDVEQDMLKYRAQLQSMYSNS